MDTCTVISNQARGKVDLGIQVYTRAEELEAIADDFRLLGFRPGKTMVSTSRSELLNGHVIEGLSYKFPVYSSAAFAFFKSLGVPVGRKADEAFEIPAWILRAPASVQDAYLRGLFGAEMTAPSFYNRDEDRRRGEFIAPVSRSRKPSRLMQTPGSSGSRLSACWQPAVSKRDPSRQASITERAASGAGVISLMCWQPKEI